eukprot:UN2656
MRLYVQTDSRLQQREGERKRQWKVDRVLAIHSLSSTASQGTSNNLVSNRLCIWKLHQIHFVFFFIVLGH